MKEKKRKGRKGGRQREEHLLYLTLGGDSITLKAAEVVAAGKESKPKQSLWPVTKV